MNDPIVAPAAPAAGLLPGVESDGVREFGLHPRVGELWFWQWLVVAVVVAILFWQNRAMVGAIFFAMFAIQNFQELQMLGTGGFGGRRPW